MATTKNNSNTKRTPVGGDIQPKGKVNEQPKASSPVPVKRSVRLMHYKEFIAGQNLSKRFLAGFKMYLGDTEYMTADGWKEALEKYKKR
ncbi:MAG: hypothetical protein NC548_20045 [Lachnospiraceae bacterium]|nr:hypothetical protein [Lachnospiraceae bacterium]